MKIIVFAIENLTLTGGNAYNSMLYNTIKKNLFFNVEFCDPKTYVSGFALKKLITPFIELKWLKKIRKSDVVFWNSVESYHCILLLFCTRLFFPQKKIFITHHHYKFTEMNGLKKRVFRFFELNFLRMSHSIIIPSPYILDQTKQYLPSNKVTYLEIAFEDRIIENQKPVKRGQMLFVGNIEHRKGLHLLVDSLNLLKEENNEFQLNILGAIIEEHYYNDLIKSIKEKGLEDKVKFYGRVSSEVKKLFMQTSDFFVFPSLLEGYGMVIIEAMSFGLPVIAFNNSAIPYTVKNGHNGLLVVNNDVIDLKLKMLMILKDTNLKETLSKGAFETFSKSRKLPLLTEEMKNFVANLKN